MSATVSIEEAQAHLTELIEKLRPGEEVVSTRDEQPIAKLIAQSEQARRPRQPQRRSRCSPSRHPDERS